MRPFLLLIIGLLVVGLLLGLVLPKWVVFLLSLALAKSLAALSVILLMRLGLLSFGQGLFYAATAYTVAFAMRYFDYREIVSLTLLGILVSLGIAAILGLLLSRYREIFFAMLTLAFSMILYGLLVRAYQWTSGTDGLPIRPPTLLGLTMPAGYQDLFLYSFTLIMVAIAVYIVHHYFNSPLGSVAVAVQDNEVRVEYLGLSVRKAIYLTYLLAGVLAGVSGVLAAMMTGHVEPDLAYWATSGEFVIVAVLGGMASPLAPVAGSIIFEFIRTYALKYVPYSWQIILGLALILIILFMPGGLWTISDFIKKRGEAWRLSWKRST